MRIDYLAEHPGFVPTLARWHFDEWRDLIPEWSYEIAHADLANHTNRAAIPTTIVAVEDGCPIGSTSLLVEDLPEWRHLTPWVASVYVAADQRGRGIGARLVERAVEIVGELGIDRVYLLTEGQAEFYRKLGWTDLPVIRNEARPVTIMSIQPASRSRR